VRIGGVVMLLLVLISLAAPWMGTVDPSLFDPASRDLLPGKTGEITTLEGEQLKHRFIMGSDSFGRDIYSRVIYGTQVSLIVGLSTALVALAFGIVMGLMAGRLQGLGVDWAQVTTTEVYTVHSVCSFLASEIIRPLGKAGIHGITWHYSRPPIVTIEYEMDLRGCAREIVL
jgi:ABC-type dipeptide/oligopeptide/nickel transport system permease subunit